MPPDDYKAVTVSVETHEALKQVCEKYGYESQHQFIKEAVLKRCGDGDVVSAGLRRAIEQTEPRPRSLNWGEVKG